MRTNLGLVPTREDERKAPKLILVQAKDEDGFWCNISEPSDVQMAVVLASLYATENRCAARVCVGPTRQIVREFGS